MKTIIIIALLAVLCGCSGTIPLQEVKVAVPVSCIKKLPVKPDYETSKLTIKAKDGHKVAALSRDWSRSRIYEGELEATLEGCK
jgi:hypothetical protein